MKQAIKILLVDDEQDFLDVFGAILDMDGAETSFAHGYNEALDLFEKNEYDIVITDYSMPGWDGLYLLDMIKSQKPDMPVIIVSNYLNDEKTRKAYRMKADWVLKKQFAYEELLAGIQRLLRKK
ncbi:MAG: response regulator [bacterium]